MRGRYNGSLGCAAILCFLMALLIVLSGCGERPGTAPAVVADTGPMGPDIEAHGPDQWGVVCYRYTWSSSNLSCIQVMPGVQDD